MKRDDLSGKTKINPSDDGPRPGAGYLCLLIIGKEVTKIPLPDSGRVTIGRSASCPVNLADPNVSRQHAVLHIGPHIAIEDLGSSNGTRVGNSRIAAHQLVEIHVNDVIAIGDTVMMVQPTAANLRPRRLWSHGYFEGRLEDECARGALSGEAFAVMRLRLEKPEQSNLAELLFADVLRPVDMLATYAPGEYEVMLVKTDDATLEDVARRIGERLEMSGIRHRVGIAFYPRDGATPEALVQSAGRAVRDSGGHATIVHGSVMRQMLPMVKRIAAGTINTLILGETGVGKEVLAETIHRLSPRAQKPLLSLNCAALSETLLESELFGYERGAFTGAVQAKPGLLETADQGTVLLDEIGDMSLTIQAKLLRVIEQRQVMRLGALKARPIDVRFLSATNRDLEADVSAGRFRRDLFFRLNGISLVIPPLRERAQEIEELALAFAAEASLQNGRQRSITLSPEALELLVGYTWPGNIRELRNVIERAVLLCTGEALLPEHLPRDKMGSTVLGQIAARPPAAATPSVVDDAVDDGDESTQVGPPSERDRILAALQECSGNQSRAAKLLGISRRTLVSRLTEFNLPRPRKKMTPEE